MCHFRMWQYMFFTQPCTASKQSIWTANIFRTQYYTAKLQTSRKVLLWSGEATVWVHFFPGIVFLGPGLTVDGSLQRGTKVLEEQFAAKTHDFSEKGIDAEFSTCFLLSMLCVWPWKEGNIPPQSVFQIEGWWVCQRLSETFQKIHLFWQSKTSLDFVEDNLIKTIWFQVYLRPSDNSRSSILL